MSWLVDTYHSFYLYRRTCTHAHTGMCMQVSSVSRWASADVSHSMSEEWVSCGVAGAWEELVYVWGSSSLFLYLTPLRLRCWTAGLWLLEHDVLIYMDLYIDGLINWWNYWGVVEARTRGLVGGRTSWSRGGMCPEKTVLFLVSSFFLPHFASPHAAYHDVLT